MGMHGARHIPGRLIRNRFRSRPAGILRRISAWLYWHGAGQKTEYHNIAECEPMPPEYAEHHCKDIPGMECSHGWHATWIRLTMSFIYIHGLQQPEDRPWRQLPVDIRAILGRVSNSFWSWGNPGNVDHARYKVAWASDPHFPRTPPGAFTMMLGAMVQLAQRNNRHNGKILQTF